jgi:hypothetical protein
MVLTDLLMAGLYPNLIVAVKDIYKTSGISGFYVGLVPNLVQKLPSYAITWVLYQQLKKVARLFYIMMHGCALALDDSTIEALHMHSSMLVFIARSSCQSLP